MAMTSSDTRRHSPLLALALMLRAGLTDQEISRLCDLRIRIRRGAYAGDGHGTLPESRLAQRRHEFARWLVQTGRLHD